MDHTTPALSPQGGTPDVCPAAGQGFSDMPWAWSARTRVPRCAHTCTRTHPDPLQVPVHVRPRIPILARLPRVSERLCPLPAATPASGVGPAAPVPFPGARSLLCPLVPGLAAAGSGGLEHRGKERFFPIRTTSKPLSADAALWPPQFSQRVPCQEKEVPCQQL